jgi:hypothetical protein
VPTYDTQSIINAAWGEPLTYTRSGTNATNLITGARYLAGTQEGVNSYGVYLIQKEVVTLATDAIPFDPRPRDTVTPGNGFPRVVTSVSGSPWLKFWKLEVQYPTLVDDLDQTATVLRPSAAPTDEGFANPNLATVYSSQAVRLQPDRREREFDTIGRVTTRARFVCIFGSAVLLNAGDVIRVSNVDYEVTQQSEIESLGVLTFATCERIS